MEHSKTRTWVEVNLGNLEHNYRALRACLEPECRFLGVVKANAYGHGAVPVARKLEELGAEYLAVACLEEAAALRQAGVRAPILILGFTPPEQAAEAVDLDVTQTVFTPELARALSQAAGAAGKRAKIHLKADTGMSRLGVLAHFPEAAARELDALCAFPHLEPEGIFTHFADADGDEAYTMLQFTRFLDTISALKDSFDREFEICHCAASAAMLKYPCTQLDMVRPGIALYGHYPDVTCEGLDGPGLRPVMSLYSRVAAVRDFPENTPVSYACTSRFGPAGRAAVLPIGYAGGLHRALSNESGVWLGGECRQIMGRVCMDMCMVGLSPSAEVRPGDVAEIFGPHLPVEWHADAAGTISYELLCAVSPRVPRVYVNS